MWDVLAHIEEYVIAHVYYDQKSIPHLHNDWLYPPEYVNIQDQDIRNKINQRLNTENSAVQRNYTEVDKGLEQYVGFSTPALLVYDT